MAAHEDRDQALRNFTENMNRLGVAPGDDMPTLYIDPDDSNSLGLDDETIICATCRQALNRFTADGQQLWIHARSWIKQDHEPVPVAIPKSTRTDQLCDFCGEHTQQHWVFIGDRLQAGTGNTVHDYGTGWSACEPCSAMIRAGDLDRLLDRVMRISVLAKSRDTRESETVRQQMLKMWNTFLPTVREERYVGPKREPARLDPRVMPKLQLGLIKFWDHAGLSGEMINIRNINGLNFSIPGVHAGDEEQFVAAYPPGVDLPGGVWRNHTDHIKAGIWGADLYWISSNFTQLSIMAGQDFTSLSITREQLPSPFGFMMFAEPIGEIPRPHGVAAIRGVSWTLVPGGVWLNLYIQTEDADPNITDIEAMRRERGWLTCPNAGSGMPFDTELDLPEDFDGNYITTIFAAWALLAQPGVAEMSTAPVDKKYARSFQRTHNRKLPDVNLVDLRRQPKRSSSGGNHVGRPLTERIYRKGHWKQQAYGPKRGQRRTIYVSQYIAGPEGAPLRIRPATVRVLR